MEEIRRERLHTTVTGFVQGVGFRAFVQREAVRTNLTGWVRNRWDGSVELVAEGLRRDLEVFLGSVSRGPRGSTVTGIKPVWLEATGEFAGFQVRQTSGGG